jgi:uncharacterized protein (TIGR02246 family)
MRKSILAVGVATLLLGGFIGALSVNAVAKSSAAKFGEDTANVRLQRLEDREEIRKLLNSYGRTLDQRDFAAFASLWADDAEYVGGGPMGTVKGPAAIRAALENTMAKNPNGYGSPNFHLFFNENIDVDGDRATGTSKAAFVVRADGNKPEMAILASYDDVFVRDHGQWKFLRRVVHGDIPSPTPK